MAGNPRSVSLLLHLRRPSEDFLPFHEHIFREGILTSGEMETMARLGIS
jgi:hypothetical protein